MDRFAYIAMTGAREAQISQAVSANNLANASTTGFRAALDASRNVSLTGPGFAAARAYAVDEGKGIDVAPGPMHSTGRSLDVAVQGQGWIAVQAPDGNEAYTRAGDLQVGPLGLLRTATGHPVLGDGGPIAVPPYASISIGQDGTVSILPKGQTGDSLAAVGRIRLVNPPADQLRRGDDGLIRMANGQPAAADANVQLRSGMLEGSNVNAVSELVQMIDNARNFELQVKLMKTADENGQASSQLLQLG